MENTKTEKEQELPLANWLSLSAKGKSGVLGFNFKGSGSGPLPTLNVELAKDPFSSVDGGQLFQHSNDGKLQAITEGNKILVFKAEYEPANSNGSSKIPFVKTFSTSLLHSIEMETPVSFLAFSNTGKYLLTWNRVASNTSSNNQSLEESNNNNNNSQQKDNLLIWEIFSGSPRIIAKFFQKQTPDKTSWPSIKWSSDDKVAARLVSNEAQFYLNNEFSKIVGRLKLQDMKQIALSPNNLEQLKIAAFVPEKKSAPGSVKIYSFNGSGDTYNVEAVATKSFFKAQECEMMWNPRGTSLLIKTHTDVDKSGKSYYGESNLFFLQADGKFDSSINLKKEGPVYDCSWSPNGQEFVVVYGYMPSQTTVFSTKGEPLADFGNAPKTYARFSPNGRYLCIAGFGNVASNIDIWDPKKLKKVGNMNANMKAKDSITFLEWAPDSRHLVSATLSPRLRVDNNFKIWFFDGSLVTDMKFDNSELYEVKFSPFYVQTSLPVAPSAPPSNSNTTATPQPSSTPSKSTTEAPPAPKPVGKYIPPNARGSSGGIVGASFTIDKGEEGPMKYSKSAPLQKQTTSLPPGYTPENSRNKKRRSKKKGKKQGDGKEEDEEDGEDDEVEESKTDSNGKAKEEKKPTTASNNNAPVSINAVLKGEELEKKVKSLTKKLRQIEELRKQKESGKALDANQISKLASEQSIRDELNSLIPQKK